MKRLITRLANIRHDTSGTLIPVTALVIVAFVAMGALVIDGGRLFWVKRQMQGAVDAGAMAGALELRRGNRELVGEIRPAVLNDTGLNGFDDTNSTIIVNLPPQNGPHAGNNRYVEVMIIQNVPTTFARVFSNDDSTVRARGVAGVEQFTRGDCVITLDRTARAAFKLNGTPTINSVCGMRSDSSDDTGFEVDGGPTLNAPSITVSGEMTVNGGSSTINVPVIDEGVLPEGDPLVSLPDLNYSGYSSGSYDKHNEIVSCPGGRCVFNNELKITSASGDIFFPEGIYVLEKGMDLSASTRIWGENLMFYGSGSKGIRISAPDVDFTGRTGADDPYRGILMFGDRSVVGTANNVGRGDGGVRLRGTIYFPTQHLDFAGTPSGGVSGAKPPWALVVANTLDFSGGTALNFNFPPDEEASPYITKVKLVE